MLCEIKNQRKEGGRYPATSFFRPDFMLILQIGKCSVVERQRLHEFAIAPHSGHRRGSARSTNSSSVTLARDRDGYAPEHTSTVRPDWSRINPGKPNVVYIRH
jgi:hypothetical protein